MNAPLENFRILLVDDDLVLRTMAAQTLVQAGFTVTEAANGEEGLRLSREAQPDLVLLDILMPGIDGFEACRRLRSLPGGPDLAIMMLTGLDDTDSVERAYRSGADDFITKPIHWSLLIHRVRFNLRAAKVRSELAASRSRLDNAQRLARMGSWEWSPDAGLFTFSRQLPALAGLSADALQRGGPEELLDRVLPADREALEAARCCALTQRRNYQVRYRYAHPVSGTLDFLESGRSLAENGGQSHRVEAILQDISETVAYEERMRFLSYHDVTTGLPSRQFFLEVAAHTLEQARNGSGQCALLFIDLDHFKEINIGLGNDAGDAMLKAMAFRIISTVREANRKGMVHTPEGIEVAARAGGDQFLVLLSQLRREADASGLAERILATIRQPVQLGNEESIITASVGLALYPEDGGDVATLLEHAEQACHAAQKLGRDSFVFYSNHAGQAASARLQQEADLRRAISQGEFLLHYQPRVDLACGRMVGAEALIRWQHPERGLLYPADFIPLAEESGLIRAISHCVLELACDQIADWRSRGLLEPQWSIAINLSALDFDEGDLLARLLSTIRLRGIPAECLTLELTETSLMPHAEAAVPKLAALRNAGFPIALDDFGTGYSSLGYLKRFPVDQLKVDRSFVRDLTTDPQDEAIVGAIVSLAQRFGLQVVAEGVETEGQAEKLLELGCRHAQGYHFAKPMPAADLAALLHSATLPAATH
ncbi:MAG: EAL domain-containing protein [Dechloromonas sp.]|nr:EAL domain-containing protein [Dechloromonas sp.]